MSETINKNELNKDVREKLITPANGYAMFFAVVALVVVGIVLAVIGGTRNSAVMIAFAVVIFAVVLPLLSSGFKIMRPNEAVVLTLFGKYFGTIARDGFFWVNPFCTVFNPAAGQAMMQQMAASAKAKNAEEKEVIASYSRKLSLKAMTLDNKIQKVNDEEGNPIEIGVIVIWRIKDTAKAVFNVDNYVNYISSQTDAAIRHVARQYPYDVSEAGDEKSLRGSAQEIAEVLKVELQQKVELAGIEIIEARIAHLAYAPEIAAAMLQRQQAKAIIDARIKIVEGAVGMVEMALDKLSENGIVELDNERKAAMVSNLLVVLCGSKDAQPVVNSGSLY